MLCDKEFEIHRGQTNPYPFPEVIHGQLFRPQPINKSLKMFLATCFFMLLPMPFGPINR